LLDSLLQEMEDGCGPSWSPDTNRSQNTEQDDELTIPRAAMNKMIKEILPNIRVANEARELVLSCCTEFIHLVSSESNEVCNQQQKKTISADHVLSALNRLGFGDFVKEAEEVLSECKESAAKRRRQSTRLENLGIPEEELLRQQQELFARAREAAVMQEQQQLAEVTVESSPVPPSVPLPVNQEYS